MPKSNPKTAFIVRRQSAGGGAERAAKRLAEHLSASWTVQRLSAGLPFEGRTIGSAKGPGWWRALRFSNSVDALLAGRQGVILNLERGPDCHIYRAGDGVHLRWRTLRFGSSPAWMTNPLHWLYPRLEAKTVASARFVVANSNMVRQEIEEYYPGAAHKLRVIPNGFDPAVFYPNASAGLRIRSSLSLPEACKLFLFVGGGWERKGLVQALKLVAGYNQSIGRSEPAGLLLVIGKGNPRKYAGPVTQLNMMESVRFLGPQANIQNFCQAADIFLLPTLYDPFSNACLEALACGCPVITTKNNGAAEFIDQARTGFILADNLHEAANWCRTAAIERREVADSVAGLTVEREMNAFSDLMEKCLS